MNTYLLLAAVAIAALLLYGAVKHMRGSRRRALTALAEAVPLELEEYGPELALLQSTGLPFFVDGRSCFGKLLLRMPKNDGATAYYFDCHCQLGSGAGQHERQSTMALFDFEKGAFPDFHLSAGGDIPDEASGLELADAAAFPGLPGGVKVYGRDAAALKKFFTPEITACFCEHNGWSAQGSGRYLVLYRGLGLVGTGKYLDFMAEAEKLAFNLA